MKNVFVELTEVAVDGAGAIKSGSCWVNMSRVQEMRIGFIPVPNSDPVTVTELTMNIPNYEITVMESPDVIMEQLHKINDEKPEVGHDQA
jgi:hypothetical protein